MSLPDGNFLFCDSNVIELKIILGQIHKSEMVQQ